MRFLLDMTFMPGGQKIFKNFNVDKEVDAFPISRYYKYVRISRIYLLPSEAREANACIYFRASEGSLLQRAFCQVKRDPDIMSGRANAGNIPPRGSFSCIL